MYLAESSKHPSHQERQCGEILGGDKEMVG